MISNSPSSVLSATVQNTSFFSPNSGGSVLERTAIKIRSASSDDVTTIWRILEPVFRAGDTYAIPRDIDRAAGLAYWFTRGHQVFVAEQGDAVVGSYYLRANQLGGGSHVANCGYITSIYARSRGIATAMCLHSKEQARRSGFRAMQFNFVISTNERAFRLWQHLGFEVIGRLPSVFQHPTRGLVDAFVMHTPLQA